MIWRELSAVRSVSGDLRGSRAAAQAGLNLGSEQDQVAGHLLSQLVRAETLLVEYDAADEHVRQAIDNLERAGDMTGLCTALRLLGSLLDSTGKLDEAAATLQRGLKIAERTGLVEEIGGCLVNLGLVDGAHGDHRAGVECYPRAAVTFERTDNRVGVAVAWGNRAYELFMLGDTDEARALGAQAVRLAEDVGNHFLAADVHHTLGLIAESVGDRATALAEAQAAITGFERAEMPEAAEASRELARRSAGGPDPDPPADARTADGRLVNTLTSVTSTTVADYAAAFQRHAASLVRAGDSLINHDGLFGFAGTRAHPEARLLVTDDNAVAVLREMLPSVSAGTIKVLETAPDCRALLDRTLSWARESVTAMVCLDLDAVPDLPIPAGLSLHPILRSPADGAVGIPLPHAAAAYLLAQADAAAALPLDQFISYLGSLPARARLFAAVDESGIVRATSASEATNDDARVFFVTTHPSCRGRGIGTAMTAAALRDAARLGSRQASLESTHAGVGIYTRLSFGPVGAVSVYHHWE